MAEGARLEGASSVLTFLPEGEPKEPGQLPMATLRGEGQLCQAGPSFLAPSLASSLPHSLLFSPSAVSPAIAGRGFCDI